VRSVTLASNVPLFGGGFSRSVFPEGLDGVPGRSGILVQTDSVELGHARTLGIAIVRGRDFNESDREHSPPVVIMNETAAKRFWPGEDPIGKRFRFFGDTFLHEVVGIARDIKYNTIGEEPQPYLYQPAKQAFSPQISLIARVEGDPATALGTIQREVQSLDRQLPILNPLTMEEVVRQSLFGAQMGAVLLSTFGFLALALAAIGIYGVLAYSVSLRTQEIGVRMALGAKSRDVLALILRQSMTIVGLGALAGLLLAALLARSLSALLFGVSTSDPMTFLGTAIVLAAVAMIASYLPARRATRVDPLIALRYE
jgi:putative ABC transport system permease protein